jgi:FkbM family methyltransferase
MTILMNDRNASPIAFLFPGLGDHYVDMARQLYECEPLFCEQVDHCADLLMPLEEILEEIPAKRVEEEEVLRTIIQNQAHRGNIDREQVMQHSQALLKERFKSQTVACQLQTLSDLIREHDIHCIDLLKIDVQKSELDVLMGIGAIDWGKIKQIVLEVHDIEDHLDKVTDLLKRWGYATTVTQDDLYKGSVIYTVYAVQEKKNSI